jgi:Fe2+ or Zn2+ uptake regulation protein
MDLITELLLAEKSRLENALKDVQEAIIEYSKEQPEYRAFVANRNSTDLKSNVIEVISQSEKPISCREIYKTLKSAGFNFTSTEVAGKVSYLKTHQVIRGSREHGTFIRYTINREYSKLKLA